MVVLFSHMCLRTYSIDTSIRIYYLAPIIYIITTLYDSGLLHSAFNLDLQFELLSVCYVSCSFVYAICSSLSLLIDPLLYYGYVYIGIIRLLALGMSRKVLTQHTTYTCTRISHNFRNKCLPGKQQKGGRSNKKGMRSIISCKYLRSV